MGTPSYTLTDPAGARIEISSESAEAVRFLSQSITKDSDAEYCVLDSAGTYTMVPVVAQRQAGAA